MAFETLLERGDLEWYESQLEMAALLPSGEPEVENELEQLSSLDSTERVFAELQSIDWAFTKDETNYLSHDIHPYPAKFIPQIPRHLIYAYLCAVSSFTIRSGGAVQRP